MSTHLLIRADASTQIGSGHVMRCLALAQAWQEQGGQVTFASLSTLPAAIQTRLEDEGMSIRYIEAEAGSTQDAQQTISLAHTINAQWVVVDGYVFDATYQKAIKDAGYKLLFLDDNGHASHYYADIVLNQNIHATEALYPSREPYTQLLLGTQYVLLRREFWKWRGWQREIAETPRKVLVTLGGADPDNVTLKVLEALNQVDVDSLEVVVVVGGSNPHMESLQHAAMDSPHNVRIEHNVIDMPSLMAWADVAISAGGSTVWELLFMRTRLAICIVAENQSDAIQSLMSHIPFSPISMDMFFDEAALTKHFFHFLSEPSSIDTVPLIDGLGKDRVILLLETS